jgi:hypothetical protein
MQYISPLTPYSNKQRPISNSYMSYVIYKSTYFLQRQIVPISDSYMSYAIYKSTYFLQRQIAPC